MNTWILLAFLMILSACDPGFQTVQAPGTNEQSSTDPGPGGPEDPPPPRVFNVFTEVATPESARVDRLYSSSGELAKSRSRGNAEATDLCIPALQSETRFADTIAYQVNEHFKSSKADLTFISSLYGLPRNLDQHVALSFSSFPLCPVTTKTLTQTIGGSRVPSARVISVLNQFSDQMNALRAQALNGDEDSKKELVARWSRVMMCLGYIESLTSADTSTSEAVARKVGPQGYRKPAGVKFYEDLNQPQASRLNIGLFQFTPDADGNIFPCIRHWNKVNPQCVISENASRAEMIRILGSDLQHFNSFCGVNKLIQMFSVQVNTSNVNNTHPANKKSNGSLKPSAERCVSLHFRPGNSYVHFGPFMNSTGKNLEDLANCF